MSQTEQDYFQLVGILASMPEIDRVIIKSMTDRIEAIFKESPDHAGVALAILGLAAQMELEKQAT